MAFTPLQSASADTFGSGANTFNIEFVTIGNPGNIADATGNPNPAGSVSYIYRIGTYEISRDVITKANALGSLGITLNDMSSFGGNGVNRPATGVTWNEAARLVNWLNISTGSTPAYKFAVQPGEVDYNSNANIELWAPSDAGYDPNNLFRNKLARYFLPSVNEWYKAAYYDPTSGVYYDYPTGSNAAPMPVASGTAANTSVYNLASATGPADITLAGGLSPLKTMGQGGNVWEWEETDADLLNDSVSSDRGLRGGTWINNSGGYLHATSRNWDIPTGATSFMGFRVASIPEPGTLLLGALASLGILWRRRSVLRSPILSVVVIVSVSSHASAVTIDMVTVGNPGNAPDRRYNATGFGSVDHVYRIGKFEITAGQYTEFLNAVAKDDPNGLYNPAMGDPSVHSDDPAGFLFGFGANIQRTGSSPNYSYSVASDWANRPVNYVSFWDAARFANWLHNGQPTGPQGPGTTEDGAYDDVGIQPGFGRNVGARFFIPTEDEWYKAAYHDKSAGIAASYFVYPTGTNAVPGYDIHEATNEGNNANYSLWASAFGPILNFAIGSPYYRTVVGEFELSDSPYGTFDQGGNVWEWHETEIYNLYRPLRGAGFNNNIGQMRADYYTYATPLTEYSNGGFRVAGIAIPEPSTLLLGAMASLGLLMRRRPDFVRGAMLIAMLNLSFNARASADTFGSGANTFDIEFVTIGNPGNAADTTGSPNPAGSVTQMYRIGQFEISEQMIDKANALGGLGITKFTRGPDKPATSVSWNEAARFVNWLNTSTGSVPAYKFAVQPAEPGYDTFQNILLWDPSDPGYNPNNLYRNSFARYFLPSVHEWYKAAYYDPTSGAYYDYANGSNTPPICVVSGTAPGTAVCGGVSGPADITIAGGLSPYGTMGQGGNVFELQETDYDLVNDSSSSAHGMRGGDWVDLASPMRSTYWNAIVSPNGAGGNIGFRIASTAVPEPSTLLLAALAVLALLPRKRCVLCAAQRAASLVNFQPPLTLAAIVFALFANCDRTLSATVAAARTLPTGTNVTIDDLVLTVLYDQVNSTASKRIFGQDATGGTAIFDLNAPIDLLLAGPDTVTGTSDDLVPGSRISLTGKTDAFSGLFAIGAPLSWTYHSAVPVPAPIPMHLAQWYDGPIASAEASEGMLVRLQSVTFASPGAVFAGLSNYDVFEGLQSGHVRVSNANHPPPIVGLKIPTGILDVVGILSQFDTNPLANRGYELLINEPSDLIIVPEPASIWLLVIACTFAISRRARIAPFLIVAIALSLSFLVSQNVRAVIIETVPVGDVGNPNDPATGNLYGGVSYAYNIGKYEVTVGQYAAFLNAVAATDSYGLYDTSMGLVSISRTGLSGSYSYSVVGSPNHPVVFVNWGDAARFANWLHNGQTTGQQNASTTEDGAYLLNGAINEPDLGTVSRRAGAKWFIPTENEWYKAAYHQPVAQGGDTDNYWDYPTRTNSEPNSDQPVGDVSIQANVANFFRDDSLVNGYNDGYAVTGSTVHINDYNYRTDVGAYASAPSFYGTFDQGGNVFEWTETGVGEPQFWWRIGRGGSYANDSYKLHSENRNIELATIGGGLFGFRVATILPRPGDFNNSGAVDAADYVVWRKQLGGIYTPDDYNTWRAHFGAALSSGSGSMLPSAGPPSAAVPEPPTVMLPIWAAAGAFIKRSQRTRSN